MYKQLADTLIEFIKREITGTILDPSTLKKKHISREIEDIINKFLTDDIIRKQKIRNGITEYRYTYSPNAPDDPSLKNQLQACLTTHIQYINTELNRYCESILNRYQELRNEVNHSRSEVSNAKEGYRLSLLQARNVIDLKAREIITTPNKYRESFLKIPEIRRLKNSDIEILWDEYIAKWNSHQHEINHQSRDRKLNAARELINKKATSISQEPSRYHSSFMNLQPIRLLDDDDKQLIWNEYVTKWNEHQSIPKPRLFNTYIDKLRDFISRNHDRELTFDEFKTQAPSGWERTSTPIEKWYEKYHDLFYKHPGTFTEINNQLAPKFIAFKSPSKIKSLKSTYPQLNPIEPSSSSYFPLKDNKKYQLHKVSPKDTYIIDLVFSGKLCYLFAINVNTRYLFVELMNEILFSDNEEDNTSKISKTNVKTTDTFIHTLQKLIDRGMNVKHLQADGEKAFGANKSLEFYKSMNITFASVPRMRLNVSPSFMKPIIPKNQWNKSAPMHSSLGILDRVVRTIRDMAYNMKVGIITPGIMKVLVNQYNNAPHNTLSKYVGMDISPQMVQDDSELEDYIIRQIHKENYNIMNQPGFKLPNGTSVKIYNENDSMMKRRSIIQPGKYHIVDSHDSIYTVADDKNNTQLIPRYKLDVTI